MKKDLFKKMLLTAMCCLSLVSVLGISTNNNSVNTKVGYKDDLPY